MHSVDVNALLPWMKFSIRPVVDWQDGVFLGILCLLTILIPWAYSYHRSCAQFPGPPVKNFWVGNLDQTMMSDVHEKWRSWHRVYGPVFQTWNGPFSRVIYVGDPSIISTIANSNWPKAPGQYEGFRPLSGNALFMPKSHAMWLKQRKSLAPAFGPQNIKLQFPTLAKYLAQYTNLVGTKAAHDQVIDLSSLHILLTLDFVGEIGFGNQLNALTDGNNCRILQMFEAILPELMKCGLFPLRAKIPILQSTRNMHAAIAELKGMAEQAVKDARKTDDIITAEGKPRKRIFEILVQQREQDGSYTFSTQDLIDNYVTFLVAGGDPTAHTLSFAVYEILCHPEVLARLRIELDHAISSPNVIPSIESVKLPYLNAIIKETLRYNGPGFGTFRYCPRDTEVGGVTFPANTTLALWNPQVHRDPNLWGKDVDEFRPERWLDPISRAPAGSYFPFSYGPRNCLGQGLAMLEITLTLATLFRQFDLRLEEGFEMEYSPSFTLCPKNGLRVCAKRRVS